MPTGQWVHSAVHSNYMEKQPWSFTTPLIHNRLKKKFYLQKEKHSFFFFFFFFKNNRYVAAYCKSFDCKKLQHDVIMESSALVILSIMNHLERSPHKK